MKNIELPTAMGGICRVEQLEACSIIKKFPGVLANDEVSFDVHSGEVHALLGENGAGKSTLMKQLYGIYRPDKGQIKVNGEVMKFKSPMDAISTGIGMVHQHFMLIPTLTVAENVALGLPSSRGWVLDTDRVSLRLKELEELYHLQVDPDAKVWQLSVGEQQRVEILKALYRNASLLILDEPTAVLTPQETDGLFATLRKMVQQGLGIVFISHKLWEVMQLSSRVTVMRSGRVVGHAVTEHTNEKRLASMMVGREFLMTIRREKVQPGPVGLMLENVSCLGADKRPALRDVSLEVQQGEVLGLAGVSGNGQRDLAEAIVGLRSVDSGTVTMNGVDVTNWSTAQLMKQGLSYIPEARMVDGIVGDFSVTDNLILKDHGYPPYSTAGFLHFKAIRSASKRLIAEYEIKTPSPNVTAKSLSGGNIQKLILARELDRSPQVVIASQPTRGVDIRASEYLRNQIIAQRKNGTTTLVISEDLDELLSISDRIAVIYEGEIMGVLPKQEASIDKLGLMLGGRRLVDIVPDLPVTKVPLPVINYDEPTDGKTCE